jgi:hypothetical protein
MFRNKVYHEDNQGRVARYKEEALAMLIPQVRPAHKDPISPWEMIHLPGGDNAVGG